MTNLTLNEYHFNSIKVQLKLYMTVIAELEKQFQFHKGTIKTLPLSSVELYSRHFNSIKVQLKQ